MMSGDCQSQGLAEWLQSLGWREGLQPSDLRKLNTPKMRSIWRHLQAQVVTTHIANTIRKNVLLARLEEENIFVGQFRNFKLDSINQLYKVNDVIKIEEEKDKVKEEIKTIDGKLQIEKSNLLQKNTIVEWERHKLYEIEVKTMILELKHAKLLKDCKKVNADKQTAVLLKSLKTSISHSEVNYQKSLVCKYVKNYRYPFKDTDDDSEYLCEMMGSILEFKPDNILYGISHVAKEALSSLNPKVDITASMRGRVSSKKIVTFQENLRDLKILTIRKELNICECLEIIKSESNELLKEKAELVRAYSDKDEYNSSFEKKSDGNGSDGFEKVNLNHCKEPIEKIEENGSSNKHANQVLNDVLEKVKEERKNTKLWEEKNLLMPDDEFEPVEDLKRSVISLTAEEDELWREFEKKVDEINTVTSTIFSCLVDSGELNELLAEISQLASDFKSKTSQIYNKNIDSSELTDMLLKEIEVFQGTPMVALQRKWDTSNEMLRDCSTKKFSNNPTLLQFLLKSEEKNSIINILEKYFWSLNINPQFH